MAAPVLVVTGLNEVTASFVGAAATVQAKALVKTRAAAEQIRDAQRAAVPVLEGTTRRSVNYETSITREGVEATVGADHFVARFLQFGTVRMSPKMDLFAASQPGVDSWLDAMSDIAEVD